MTPWWIDLITLALHLSIGVLYIVLLHWYWEYYAVYLAFNIFVIRLGVAYFVARQLYPIRKHAYELLLSAHGVSLN